MLQGTSLRRQILGHVKEPQLLHEIVQLIRGPAPACEPIATSNSSIKASFAGEVLRRRSRTRSRLSSVAANCPFWRCPEALQDLPRLSAILFLRQLLLAPMPERSPR